MAALAKSVYFFLGAVLAILMVDCTLTYPHGDRVVQSNMSSITVTEKDNGGEFELNRGDVLMLKLESNPSTGFSWHIVRNDDRLMELMGKPAYEVPERKPLVGGIEYKIFRFKALTSGTNVLELHYKRIWEKGKEPVQTFMITVKIK